MSIRVDVTRLAIFFAVVLIPFAAVAATHTASSCSMADVATSISAASNGDTVRIPAGECIWGAGKTYLAVNKSIILEGVGESTIISLAADAPTYSTGTIRLAAQGATVRRMTVRAPAGVTTTATAFSTSANDFRISGIRYVGTTGICTGYFVYFGSYGVIDDNAIIGSSGSQELIFGRGPTDAWQTNSTIGAADNVFIEDNVLSGAGYLTDCNSNSRCVVRYNTISSASKIDGHGKCTNSPARSVRHMEIYGNYWSVNGFYTSVQVRGGTGVVFFNKSDNVNGASSLQLVDYATFQAGCNGYQPDCGCPDDYPLDDQIGLGKDPKSAASEPIYLWNNRILGQIWLASRADWQLTNSVCSNEDKCGSSYTAITQIQNNRDYYDYASTFDGSAGTGCGAARPLTCVTGTAYWETAQSCSDLTELVGAHPATPIKGTLYKCIAPNTWVQFYTPFPYPHPRRGSPSTPGNLRVVL